MTTCLFILRRGYFLCGLKHRDETKRFSFLGEYLFYNTVSNPALQGEQMKQSLCQCRPSKEMNLVPPIPGASVPPMLVNS
jgi:hypothetical protein